MDENSRESLILLTGVTGYVGGRLYETLLERGRRVRCMARRPAYLKARYGESTEAIYGDVQEPDTLRQALEGVETAYYLIHSMGAQGSFESLDAQGATHFARAAAETGVKRIIYLGGLADESVPLSAHMRSRIEVGKILRSSGVPVLEFRSSIVLGSGSLSFEMIRSLVERLPVMITPRWVQIEAQPIAIRDLLAYLAHAVETNIYENRIVEIGGGDVASYGEIMLEYARQRGLKRFMIPAPLLTPYLSSLWLGLVTPIYARVGRCLIESIRHPSIVLQPTSATEFPIRPMGLREAIEDALRNEDRDVAATRWSDALSMSGGVQNWQGVQFGMRFIDSRAVRTDLPAESLFTAVMRIGGKNGWYAFNWLWTLRGWLDLLTGGIGMRRGRRHPDFASIGDTIDFWRVENVETNRCLRLSAEMKLPGRAWLQFEIQETGKGTELRQTAIFDPLGLWGRCYWYAVYPIHAFVFKGMLHGIVKYARKFHESTPLFEKKE